jgi:hypothetical protein
MHPHEQMFGEFSDGRAILEEEEQAWKWMLI